MLLGQHAERGVVTEGVALCLAPLVEGGVTGEAVPEGLQGLHLEPEDCVTVDVALGVQSLPGGG